MTTIAIAKASQAVAMSCDSGITDGAEQIMPPMTKIVNQGSWLIAVAGEDRTCDVLQYVVKYPNVPNGLINKPLIDWLSWLTKKVIPIVRKTSQAELSLDIDKGVAYLPDNDLILATHGKAFYISATLGINNLEPYWAIGSGSSLAIGSLSTGYDKKLWDKNFIRALKKAVGVAIQHDSYSHDPIHTWISRQDGSVNEI